MSMDDLVIARVLHVLAIVHWIGGVLMVTAVILPMVRVLDNPGERLARFEAIERRFAGHARISTLIAGATGFWMTYRMDAWMLFFDPSYWWMHAMVLIWLLFTLMLFVIEPLWLHDWFARWAIEEPDRAFAAAQRLHVILIVASLITITGAIVGAHGGWIW